MKRIIVVALVALLSLALFAFPAFADGEYIFHSAGSASYVMCDTAVADGNYIAVVEMAPGFIVESKPFKLVFVNIEGFMGAATTTVFSTPDFTYAVEVEMIILDGRTLGTLVFGGTNQIVPFKLIPYVGKDFISYVELAMESIFTWAHDVLAGISVIDNGSIVYFLILVPVGISAIFLGIYIFRKFIWGA